jgi:RNA polymerase primary sigma factor
MDLISEGNLALLEAAKRFDPSKDARFVTYAGWWLRQAMLEAISKDYPLSLTPKTLGQIYRMERAASSLRRDLERAPSLEELAEELGLRERDVQALQQAGMEFLSLSKPTGDDGTMVLAEILPERDLPSPEFVMLKRSFEDEVRALVGELQPNEAAVIRQRFGLGGDDPASLQKIADRLHLSRERVRQLETRALRRMRALARGLKLEGFLR